MLLDKLNEPKLKNFSEIDAYVVLSCPRSSFFDYKEFYKVAECEKIVLTPYELGLALGEFEWDSNIYFDKEITVSESQTDEEAKKDRDHTLNRQLVSM